MLLNERADSPQQPPALRSMTPLKLAQAIGRLHLASLHPPRLRGWASVVSSHVFLPAQVKRQGDYTQTLPLPSGKPRQQRSRESFEGATGLAQPCAGTLQLRNGRCTLKLRLNGPYCVQILNLGVPCETWSKTTDAALADVSVRSLKVRLLDEVMAASAILTPQ